MLGITNNEYPMGNFFSKKFNKIVETDKTHLKCDFVDGSFVNGFRQNFINSLALDNPLGYKLTSDPINIL